MTIEIRGGEVSFKEIRGGDRGTDYFYVESGGELLPVRELGREEFVDEWGRGRKEYEIKVGAASVEGKRIYHFSFSNSGSFFTWLYEIRGGNVRELGSLRNEDVKRLRFRAFGDERGLFEKLKRMAEEINEIMRSRSLTIFFAGDAERLKEVIVDPDAAYVTSMVYPEYQSRRMSLEGKIRAAHEMWVLAHTIDALGGRVTRFRDVDTLWIETASERPRRSSELSTAT